MRLGFFYNFLTRIDYQNVKEFKQSKVIKNKETNPKNKQTKENTKNKIDYYV